MSGLWRRIVALGFRLLYNELAWLYDPVSWAVSLGQWRRWQRAVWAWLPPPPGQVLEVGFGPGHLLVELIRAGYAVVGLDLSPAMLRLARHRLRRQGIAMALCRGRAEALPFGPRVFDAVILTFPAAFVYDPAWIGHLARVIRVGGRLVVVEMASLPRRDLRARCLEPLYRVTGQRGPVPPMLSLLEAVGLVAWRETAGVAGSRVSLVVAEKRAIAGAVV